MVRADRDELVLQVVGLHISVDWFAKWYKTGEKQETAVTAKMSASG